VIPEIFENMKFHYYVTFFSYVSQMTVSRHSVVSSNGDSLFLKGSLDYVVLLPFLLEAIDIHSAKCLCDTPVGSGSTCYRNFVTAIITSHSS
jgi:hypothetical protein